MILFKQLVIFFELIFVLTSCATLLTGPNQKVPIQTDPPGATVYVNQTNVGRTPLNVKLQRKQTHYIRMELANYLPYEMVTSRKRNILYWGNILLGGGLGMGIDKSTGAAYEVVPNKINVTLQSLIDTYPKDTISKTNYVRADSIFDPMSMDSMPAYVGNKETLFNLFQKAEQNHFFINVIINEDGSINEASFNSDDKYIARAKSILCKELKFNPGKANIDGEWKSIKTAMVIKFTIIEAKKLSQPKAILDIEKTVKNNIEEYVVKKIPEGYTDSTLNEIIDYRSLLSNEKSGIYEFNLNKYNITGMITLNNNPNPIYKKETDIIKFKFKKFVYE